MYGIFVILRTGSLRPFYHPVEVVTTTRSVVTTFSLTFIQFSPPLPQFSVTPYWLHHLWVHPYPELVGRVETRVGTDVVPTPPP